MAASVDQSGNLSIRALENMHAWKLEDAKARFSEVVRLARDQSPQRITVGGEDAVVVLSSKDFARLLPLLDQPSLHALLSQSPLSSLEFEQPSVSSIFCFGDS